MKPVVLVKIIHKIYRFGYSLPLPMTFPTTKQENHWIFFHQNAFDMWYKLVWLQLNLVLYYLKINLMYPTKIEIKIEIL